MVRRAQIGSASYFSAAARARRRIFVRGTMKSAVGPIPLSLSNVEDLLQEGGSDISHETVRFWWNGFGPLFAGPVAV